MAGEPFTNSFSDSKHYMPFRFLNQYLQNAVARYILSDTLLPHEPIRLLQKQAKRGSREGCRACGVR